jgi:type VI secretion system protein ImpE
MDMEAKVLIQAGRLADARECLTTQIRQKPADMAGRILLFQVLACYGEWDQARAHLEILATQDSKIETGVQEYLNLVNAETERLEVFKDARLPAYLPEAPPYAGDHEKAREHLRANRCEDACEILEDIAARIPAMVGSVNQKPFQGLRDTDALLAFFLEAYAHGRYVWVAYENVRELLISQPRQFVDLLWVPALVTTWEGITLNCRLPVLYPETFKSDADQLKMGRMTDWIEWGPGCFKGVGQHVLRAGEEELALLDIREAIFENPSSGHEHAESA